MFAKPFRPGKISRKIVNKQKSLLISEMSENKFVAAEKNPNLLKQK